ncbi:MAG: hypothetical protein AAGU32_00210 [Bacillota bacterium]
MKNKRILIALGSIALVIALFVGSYVIRQNQFQAILPVSAMMGNEDIDGATADNKTADYAVADEIENGFALSAEPSAKLDKIYEEAMANSDLEPYEIELIRSMVGKENKTFEQALQAVRPGSKVIQEQAETQTVNNNQKPQQPTTQASGNTSNSATANNSDNRSDAQKKAEEDFFNDFGDGVKGKSDPINEPEFGLPDNRTDQQKYDDNNDPFSSGVKGKSDPINEPDFGLPDNRTDQQKYDDNNDPFSDGHSGPGRDTSFAPDF